jgi:large subunit ribosomal protein L17
MFRNMVTSLFKYEKIQTTDVKAKELRRWADRLVTLAKRGDLHALRQALAIIREKDVVYKLFDMAPERFGSINGGYTRIIKVGRRAGDAAPMSIIELVAPEEKKKKTKKKKTKATAEKKTDAVKPKKSVKKEAAKASEESQEEKVEALETAESAEMVETDNVEATAPAESETESSAEAGDQATEAPVDKKEAE